MAKDKGDDKVHAQRPSASSRAQPTSPTRKRKGDEAIRSDAPSRTSYARGTMPPLLTPEDRSAALHELQKDAYAKKGAEQHESKIKTIKEMLMKWDMELLPPSLDIVNK